MSLLIVWVIDHKLNRTDSLPPHPQVLQIPPVETDLTIRKPAQTPQKTSETSFIVLYSIVYITYLYILSIGALDRWSSPKGVLEIGRTTPKTKTQTHNVFIISRYSSRTTVDKSHMIAAVFVVLVFVLTLFNLDNPHKKAPTSMG